MEQDRVEVFVRRHLQNCVGRLGDPAVVALLHGSLAGLHRTRQPVPVDVVCQWAAEEGWPQDQVLVLRGIALAAENATADLGELTTTRAADHALVVCLTEDEAKLARAGLASIMHGPHAIPEWEFHTLMGFRSDEARVLLDSLRGALGEHRAAP